MYTTPLTFCLLLLLAATQMVRAQVSDSVFATDSRLRQGELRSLSLEVDNLNFFRNVESATYAAKGYTLPGFRLQAKAVYRPAESVSIEAGVHSLWFWGANRYPAFAYNDIAVWRGESRPTPKPACNSSTTRAAYASTRGSTGRASSTNSTPTRRHSPSA